MVPRDVASRAAKERCDAGFGVGESKKAVFLDFSRAIQEQGEAKIREKYGNLFHMYQKITDENPYKSPMRIYPLSTTRWAGCGSTITCRARSPACSCWVRPTSPTTVQIAWEPVP